MFFSVITITYNSSQFIRDAIESVLSSSYSNFEYIIGDDCSTDDTWAIIQEYDDPRIIRYRNEHNMREYPNRNKAISIARGNWILFIDGDDIIYSHSLNVLFEILSRYNNIAIAVMCPENVNYIAPLLLNSGQIYQIEFSEHGLINRALSHTIFKTEILKNNPFEVDGFVGLDTLCRLQILMTENCLLIQDNLTFWRTSPNQASNKIKNALRNEQFAMSYILFNKSQCPLSQDQIKRYYRNSKIKLTRLFLILFLKLKIAKCVELYKSNRLVIWDFRHLFMKIDYINPIHSIETSLRYSLK